MAVISHHRLLMAITLIIPVSLSPEILVLPLKRRLLVELPARWYHQPLSNLFLNEVLVIKNIKAITLSSYLAMLFLGVGASLIGAAARSIGLTPYQIGLLVAV